MNAPYKDRPAFPSAGYLDGILQGCEQNGIDTAPIKAAALDALERADLEEKPPKETKPRTMKEVRDLEPKTIILLCLAAVIVGGLVFLHIRNNRKKS